MKTERQPHGGALNRGGRPKGAKNARTLEFRDVVKPTHKRKAWARLV